MKFGLNYGLAKRQDKNVSTFIYPPINMAGDWADEGEGGVVVNLTWENDSRNTEPITMYIVLRDGTKIDETTELFYSDYTVTEGVEYTYHTKAVTAVGKSRRSDAVTIIVAEVLVDEAGNTLVDDEGNTLVT